jgi:Mn2+/Fe2+ NRAMP family transporter
MGEHANGPWLNLLGWLATALMFVAAVAFFVTSL